MIAAIDWVVQHRNDNGLNIRVINLSYGTNSTQPYGIDPLAYAVEQAWKAGIVVVAAAGNTGYQNGANAQGSPIRPTTRRSSRSVQRTRWGRRPWDDQVASFSAGAASCSNGCRAPDLIAPGTHMQGLRVPGSYIDQNNPAGVSERPLLPRQRHLGGDGVRLRRGRRPAAALSAADAGPGQGDADRRAATSCSATGSSSGCGELDMGKLLERARFRRCSPRSSTTRASTGTGSLEASRGSDHSRINGVVLQGEQDIFGMPFDSAAMAALEAAGSSWSGGIWNGSSWSGSSWSGSSWAVRLEWFELVGQLVERLVLVG